MKKTKCLRTVKRKKKKILSRLDLFAPRRNQVFFVFRWYIVPFAPTYSATISEGRN